MTKMFHKNIYPILQRQIFYQPTKFPIKLDNMFHQKEKNSQRKMQILHPGSITGLQSADFFTNCALCVFDLIIFRLPKVYTDTDQLQLIFTGILAQNFETYKIEATTWILHKIDHQEFFTVRILPGIFDQNETKNFKHETS